MFLPSSGADLIVSGSVGGRLSTSNTVAAARHEQLATLVPGYSGGTATDSHRLPYSPASNALAGTHVGGGWYRSVFKLQRTEIGVIER